MSNIIWPIKTNTAKLLIYQRCLANSRAIKLPIYYKKWALCYYEKYISNKILIKLLLRLVNQQPIVSYTITNYNGVYASKSSSLNIKCSHVIECSVLCRLYKQETSSTQFEICRSLAFGQIENGLDYIYEIHASDAVNNTALTQIRFKADTLPPELSSPPLMELLMNCGDDLAQVQTPQVRDNFDPTPQIGYTDRKQSSCQISREWITRDHVNNTAMYIQRISLTSQTTISYPNVYNMSCVDNNQVLKVSLSWLLRN